MPILTLNSVTKIFFTLTGPKLAVADVSLALDAGEFLCVVGPSGCGKTTLLNLIAGLELPDKGDVLFEGAPVSGPGLDRVVMFQESALFPWLNALENIGFGLKMAGVPHAVRDQRAQKLLRLVGLADQASSWIYELSGGMKQRVALARALAVEPRILLMDEPFAALDAQTRDQLHIELEAIWEQTGTTIIFVTHNVREAVRLGNRVLLMTARDGRIKREYPIDLPRHRTLEDVELVKIASVIRDDLKEEVLAAGGRHG